MVEPPPDAVTSVTCHLEGITRICFSPKGRTIFTGGTDCLVRIHKADDPDSEPGFHDNHDEAITSLTCSNTHLITASTDNIARVFSYPANEFEGFVTRSSGVPIRWVSVDQQGERVVVCSDDLLVKIVHVNDTTRVSLLSDNIKPVRSATWDPSGKYLTTVSCDAKIRVYDTTGSEPVLVKVLDGVIASSETDSPVSCYAVWHPAGNYFVVPTRTNEIAIINREGWTKGATFSADGHRAAVSELAWSPNGRYLASASGSQILVWSTESKQIIARYSNPEGNITGLAFSPISNLLVFTSLDGSFSRWKDPIPASLPSPVTSEAVAAKDLDKLLDDEFGEDDVDMEEKGEELGDDLADDWIVDDDGAYGGDDDERRFTKGRTEVVNVTKAQDAFAPGSTAMRAKKRYLTFNMIGSVDVADQDTHNVINVEFHDKSARRGYHFQDHHKFSVASIGEQGIVYAAASEGDQPSTVHYRPYDSWASQSDWSISLLPGEDATGVAAGGGSPNTLGSVVVATSKGYVRFLSSSGIQRYLWRIGDEVITLAASKEAVIIVHREGGTSLDGCQNLRYTILDLDSFDILQEGRIPLPKKVQLSWVGFTAEGVPAIYDSTGLLSVLDRYRRSGQARWLPLLDTATLARREGKQENYWPVGVTATQFACVILKGNEKEPWFPRPLVQEIDLQMPLLNMDNQQGKLEESVIRGQVQLSHLRDSIEEQPDSDVEYTIKQREVALDKELLQLVQGACKADHLQRALDLTRLMHNPATVDAAAKVAGFYHLPGLQERITGVKSDTERRRVKDVHKKKARRSEIHASNGHGYASTSSPAPNGPKKEFSDFAPREKPRRSFGGVTRNRDSTPLSTAPLPSASARSETYIPETPRDESVAPFQYQDDANNEDEDDGPANGDSPETKRKRDREPVPGDEENFAPVPVKKRADDFPLTKEPPKNPFAKKSQQSNPFAKPANPKPLEAIKSTSFFERVDNIESSGAPKAKPRAKKDKSTNAPPASISGSSGKQQTLFNFKSGPTAPKPITRDSTDTEVDEDANADDGVEVEETVEDEDNARGILEETQIQETMTMSPEPESFEA